MLVEISKTVTLAQSADRIWSVVRDPATVASAISNVRDFRAVDGGPTYTATIEDKLGPFKVEVPVTAEVTEDPSARRMTVRIAGNDSRGQARVSGEVSANVVGTDSESRLEVSARIEVLGRLAALGAVPMRRRADQIFETFIKNLAGILSGSTPDA